MYNTPIVRHGFRQGAFRACIYITRRAHRNFMPDYLFWNLPDFDKSNIKRRLRLNLMYQSIRTDSLPHCHQQFPSRHRAWVRLTACKDIQNLPNCQTIREIFCDYSWVLLSPMFIFPFLPSIFILSRYACSTGERVFTWYLRYSRDCNDKKNSKRHMSHGNLRFFSSPHLTPPTLIF